MDYALEQEPQFSTHFPCGLCNELSPFSDWSWELEEADGFITEITNTE